MSYNFIRQFITEGRPASLKIDALPYGMNDLSPVISKATLDYHYDYHFKPVCNPIEMPEAWAEIEAFRIEMDISKRKTWLMPPGDTRDELIRVYPMVMDFCRDNGYNFTGREHIIAFDQRREV